MNVGRTLPHQSVGSLTGGVQHDEPIAAGKLILPALIASDPTGNQRRLQVVDDGVGRFVDVKGSEI
jgi:hypothetical protein